MPKLKQLDEVVISKAEKLDAGFEVDSDEEDEEGDEEEEEEDANEDSAIQNRLSHDDGDRLKSLEEEFNELKLKGTCTISCTSDKNLMLDTMIIWNNMKLCSGP